MPAGAVWLDAGFPETQVHTRLTQFCLHLLAALGAQKTLPVKTGWHAHTQPRCAGMGRAPHRLAAPVAVPAVLKRCRVPPPLWA